MYVNGHIKAIRDSKILCAWKDVNSRFPVYELSDGDDKKSFKFAIKCFYPGEYVKSIMKR